MDKYIIPISIVVAGVLVGGAVLYTNAGSSGLAGVAGGNVQPIADHQVTPERALALVDPKRDEGGNVYGNPGAPVTIVEFSDFECPFCSRVHPTLKKLVDESEGTVNWQYRHLPLSSHPNARAAALAAECVAEIAGNDAFWEFGSYLFANQRSLGELTYQNGAKAVGVEKDLLALCMARTDIAEIVLEDEKTAVALGGGGTPYSVIVYEDGTTRAVPGALPYNQFKALVSR